MGDGEAEKGEAHLQSRCLNLCGDCTTHVCMCACVHERQSVGTWDKSWLTITRQSLPIALPKLYRFGALMLNLANAQFY